MGKGKSSILRHSVVVVDSNSDSDSNNNNNNNSNNNSNALKRLMEQVIMFYRVSAFYNSWKSWKSRGILLMLLENVIVS